MSNSQIVNDFIAAWEALDADRILSFFAEGAVYHNIPMPMMTGHDQIARFIKPFLASAKSARFIVHHQAENEAGTVLNERTDVFELVDGKTLSIRVMGVFELSGGKITAWRDYFDMKAFESQTAG
jgi:limonene-1,2-epoxide hydrolase